MYCLPACMLPAFMCVLFYHWRELTQVSFLSRQNTSFVSTKVCLPRQNICRDKICLSGQTFCHDKHTFVTTKDVFCPDKHDKSKLVATKVFCRDKHIFVATEDMFCRDKHMIVATKIILMAAPANDTFQPG